jgi:hypothetical protein
VFSEDFAQFTRQKNRFLVSRPDDVSSRPDAKLSKAPAIRTTCQTVQTPKPSKHHPFGCRGFPSGPSSVSRSFELLKLASVRTRFSLRQVCNSNSTVQTPVCHGPDARESNMEITCIKSTILMVRTREAFIWKLLAADVQPSGRQGNTVRMRVSNRKDFQRNS